jgi:hypothetical protein
MEPNLGRTERLLRGLLGLSFLAVAATKYELGLGSVAVGALAGLAGLGLLVSGLTGYCGVYAVLGTTEDTDPDAEADVDADAETG